MRQLIYVPIVHTEADLGSMAKFFEDEFKRRYSSPTYQVHVYSIAAMWAGIVGKITALNLDWPHVRLYQDGLPVCGRETEIVSDLAQQGSINHQLLVNLMSRGARLEGTESKDLLLQEYDYVQRISTAKNPVAKQNRIAEYARAGKALLEARDRFIAQRIDGTLLDGETGVLFMGMMHAVDKFLPKDIKVQFVIHRLPFDQIPGYARK